MFTGSTQCQQLIRNRRDVTFQHQLSAELSTHWPRSLEVGGNEKGGRDALAVWSFEVHVGYFGYSSSRTKGLVRTLEQATILTSSSLSQHYSMHYGAHPLACHGFGAPLTSAIIRRKIRGYLHTHRWPLLVAVASDMALHVYRGERGGDTACWRYRLRRPVLPHIQTFVRGCPGLISHLCCHQHSWVQCRATYL